MSSGDARRSSASTSAARAAGKTWGGSAKGRRLKVTEEQEAAVYRMKGEGVGVSAIARATGLSRPTSCRVPGRGGEATIEAREGRRKPRSRRRV